MRRKHKKWRLFHYNVLRSAQGRDSCLECDACFEKLHSVHPSVWFTLSESAGPSQRICYSASTVVIFMSAGMYSNLSFSCKSLIAINFKITRWWWGCYVCKSLVDCMARASLKHFRPTKSSSVASQHDFFILIIKRGNFRTIFFVHYYVLWKMHVCCLYCVRAWFEIFYSCVGVRKEMLVNFMTVKGVCWGKFTSKDHLGQRRCVTSDL